MFKNGITERILELLIGIFYFLVENYKNGFLKVAQDGHEGVVQLTVLLNVARKNVDHLLVKYTPDVLH